jgi:hypothetical protein
MPYGGNRRSIVTKRIQIPTSTSGAAADPHESGTNAWPMSNPGSSPPMGDLAVGRRPAASLLDVALRPAGTVLSDRYVMGAAVAVGAGSRLNLNTWRAGQAALGDSRQ